KGLEHDKAAQQLEIVKLKARVKKLEKIDMVKSSKLRRLKKVRTSQRVESSDDMENSREEMQEEDEEIIKSINETPAQKATKRRKLHEQAKEDEDLKKQLEVVDDEDDDVFIEATPIGRKVPVVDYEIVMINNKPRYKIIKAEAPISYTSAS
nr:hypothetical protein [Tanacetum cinerariifolium]